MQSGDSSAKPPLVFRPNKSRALRGRLIIHLAELRILRSMSDQDLRAFAAENGWRVVFRLGGRQIEFYNDASTRPVAWTKG